MADQNSTTVTLPADVNQIDESGYVWSFVDGASEPKRVRAGRLIVAGDTDEPFFAHVVEVIEGPNGRQIAHLNVVGTPGEAIDELRHNRLLPPD